METQNTIEELKKQIDKQKGEINYLKESIRELESEKTNFSEIRSKILKNESPDFKKNIQKYLNDNNNIQIFSKLLYRKTRDGDTADDFKKYCTDKKNTLTIIQLSDGKILGGYTSLPWNNHTDVYNYDSESFLFNQYAKYPKRKKDIQTICCREKYGWWTYAIGFRNNNMNKLEKNSYYINDAYIDGDNIIPNMKFKDEFNVKEVETFEIIYLETKD